MFELVGDSLQVANGASIDYETATSHSVRVRATYGGGTVHESEFVVQVENKPITDIQMSSGGSVRENEAAGTLVATFQAFENPLEPTATFSLIDDANGLFVLDGNQLKVAPAATFNFGAQNSHTIIIRASDASGPAYEESFDISVQQAGPIVGTPRSGIVSTEPPLTTQYWPWPATTRSTAPAGPI